MNFSLNVLKLTIFLSLIGMLIGTAQASPANPNKDDGYQTNEQNSTTGSTFGSSFNPFDIIHNATFRRSRDAAEFSEDTQQNLNTAAQEFKRLQQEKFKQQPATSVPNSNPNPGN